MLSRGKEAGQEAIRRIRAQNSDAQVDWVEVDLGDLRQTLQVVRRLAETIARLDLVSWCSGLWTHQ